MHIKILKNEKINKMIKIVIQIKDLYIEKEQIIKI